MGNKMWQLPADSDAQKNLILNRWIFVCMIPDAGSMAIVIWRNYKNYKFPYSYTCAGCLFLAVAFDMIAIILSNWGVGCGTYYLMNDKCQGEKSADWLANITLFNEILYAAN